MYHRNFEAESFGRDYPAGSMNAAGVASRPALGFTVAFSGCLIGLALSVSAFLLGAGLWLSLLLYFVSTPMFAVLLGVLVTSHGARRSASSATVTTSSDAPANRFRS